VENGEAVPGCGFVVCEWQDSINREGIIANNSEVRQRPARNGAVSGLESYFSCQSGGDGRMMGQGTLI